MAREPQNLDFQMSIFASAQALTVTLIAPSLAVNRATPSEAEIKQVFEYKVSAGAR
jgi:hypothetical protein